LHLAAQTVHDASPAGPRGLRGSGPSGGHADVLFAGAATERRIVPTVDLDFGEIVASAGGRKVSVIVLRLRNARADRVIERLRVVLPSARNAIRAGAIVSVEESRHRIRRLPMEGDT
jgi:predicted nuclease of predicted toxin-antitoxin system